MVGGTCIIAYDFSELIRGEVGAHFDPQSVQRFPKNSNEFFERVEFERLAQNGVVANVRVSIGSIWAEQVINLMGSNTYHSRSWVKIGQ